MAAVINWLKPKTKTQKSPLVKTRGPCLFSPDIHYFIFNNYPGICGEYFIILKLRSLMLLNHSRNRDMILKRPQHFRLQ